MIITRKKRIAVIGSGISGLSAAWLLSKQHDVTVFEKRGEIGGHSNTRIVPTRDGDIPVDSGFIVYNEKNYPNLTQLFSHLNVPTTETQMSFAFSLDNGRYEYNGNGIKGLFGQKKNIVNLNHWRMVKDIQRFFEESRHKILGYDESIKLDRFLELEGFSQSFLNNHILPMAGAIWSSPAEVMKLFPAKSFLDFYENHGLLQIQKRPKWRSVLGGSEQYVNRLVNDSNIRFQLNSPVSSVSRDFEGIVVRTKAGKDHGFDEVVFGCHADQALAMLANPSALERQLLGEFSYSDNRAVMHMDESQMPRRRKLWASWNYMSEQEPSGIPKPSSVTYWMNSLQQLETSSNIFVSINPEKPIDSSRIVYQTRYQHPIFDANAMGAQKLLWELQGQNRSWFCGSYFGYGFHEDGLQSGLAVAEQLGGMKRPWNVANESARIHLGSQSMLAAAE